MVSRAPYTLLVVLAFSTGLAAGVSPPISAAAPAPVVTGRMVDLNGQPVSGVTVYLSGPGQSVTTAADGVFRVAALDEDSFFNAAIQIDHGSAITSTSTSSLTDLRIDTVNGNQIGDVVIHRLTDPRSVRTIDSDGDPLPGAQITLESAGCLHAVERPDLPSRWAEQDVVNCAGWSPPASWYRGDALGRLPIALPVSSEAAAIASMRVQVTDPASGDVYVEDFSEGVYDPATLTYDFVIEGADAAPAKPPLPVQAVFFPGNDEGPGRTRVDWYWHSDERDRAPATGFRVQVVGNRGTNSDEQVPFEPQDASYTYVFEAHPGENGTVTITALSEAGPSDPVSIEWQMLSEPPSGLDMPTVKVNHKRDLATISWAPPSSDGGDADIRYNVYLDGKRRSASNRLSLVAKRLTRGKHTVSVQAYNSGGVTESAATVFRIR